MPDFVIAFLNALFAKIKGVSGDTIVWGNEP